VQRTVAVASLVVALLALPLVFVLARRISQPIDEMRQMATRVAKGDFAVRAPETEGGAELMELGQALNEMSAQLAARLRELAEEKAELSATLANMMDGVLVVDGAGKIRLVNRALRQQFQVGEEVIGKTVLEAFRHVGLEKLVADRAAGELTFLRDEHTFAVAATALDSGVGAVVVFHDITRLRQLETVRKEFVANVSHELRTPLSIIKGYVETLLEEQPSQPFLETIQKHARRLEALIDDLLSISELESQHARLSFAPVLLRSGIVEELLQRAADKKIAVQIQLPELRVRADEERLRQVFTNLLDNAIKYTQPGGHIVVSARSVNGDVEVCVADDGPGIAPEHLPRIFERFYRADKARSRELGGTGLGLSAGVGCEVSEARLEQAEALLESFGREIEPCPRGRDLAVAVLETVFDLLVGFAIASKDFPLP
jgi:two-component system phosphate regulon sensor histidine kinase PhoR